VPDNPFKSLLTDFPNLSDIQTDIFTPASLRVAVFPAPCFSSAWQGLQHFYKDLRPLSIVLCMTRPPFPLAPLCCPMQPLQKYSGKQKAFSNLNLFVTLRNLCYLCHHTTFHNQNTRPARHAQKFARKPSPGPVCPQRAGTYKDFYAYKQIK